MENTKLDYLAKKIAEEIIAAQNREEQKEVDNVRTILEEDKEEGISDLWNWVLGCTLGVVIVIHIVEKWANI